VRNVFFALLAVNVIYLAWAGWIDTPSAPPLVKQVEPALPQLVLAVESTNRSLPLAQPVVPAAQAVPTVADTGMTSAPDASRCVSVGPFNDLAHAARGAALLRDRGFNPRQRAEEGEMWDGYWVYVGGLKSAADESKVVNTLERAGIKDAHAMPETDSGRRVSVGLFSEKDRAERRAQAVKRLGLDPEITERKQPGTVYWVDLDLGKGDSTVPTEGLLSLEDSSSRLEIRVCPGSSREPAAPTKPATPARDARPAATTADAGSPRPG